MLKKKRDILKCT